MTKRIAVLHMILLPFISFVMIFTANAQNEEREGLFIAHKGSNYIDLYAKNLEQVIDQRAVLIDEKKLNSLSVGDKIVFNLFDKTVLYGIIDEDYITNHTRKRILKGHFPNSEYGYFVLVADKEFIIGDIAFNKEIYQIRHLQLERHIILKIDQKGFPKENTPSTFNDKLESSDGKHLLDLEDIASASPPIIDVMVVYTPMARQGAGGTSHILSLIDLAVEETNLGYKISGIAQRVNLVSASEIEYDERHFNWNDTISRLTNPADGFMDDVHLMRNNNNVLADIVVLIVENNSVCGQAQGINVSESGAFAVVARSCATGNYSFAHEMGHLMGARHDWYVDDNDNAPFSFNHGYVDKVRQVRTIMAYNNECEDDNIYCIRLQLWSNPDKIYADRPMGVPEGTFHAADNRKTLNLTAYNVESFRNCRNYNYPGITLFDGANCGQQIKIQYDIETELVNLSAFGWSDKTSSIFVSPGWSIRVYQDANGYGASRCVNSSLWDLAKDTYDDSTTNMNNSISSIRVFANDSCFTAIPPTPTPPPPTPTPNTQDRTPPSASGYNVSITNGSAHLAPSGVQDNPGGSGVREVRFSAKFDGQWRGIGVASSPPYALDWNMCAMNVPNGDIEFGMEVWDNAGNKWVWSEHYPNPHATKNYDCSQTSLQDGVYLYYETGQQQDVCRIVQDTASIGDFCGARFNDHVRSIKVVGSFYFALYKDDNFSGGAPLQGNFTGDLPADWQDVVSSIRVRRTDPAVVTLYSLGDYNGEAWKTDRTIYDLGHWNWNDKAQSVEVEPGYGALICADNDFHGICGRVGASDSQRRWSDINALANGLRNSVSSIQICDGDCPPAPSAPSLIIPPENALLSPNNPVIMQWNGSALQYQVEYWGGSLGSRVTTGWQSGTSLRLETLPESREPYYWHVRGWNEYGEGGWSPVQRFYLYENRSPSSPTQLSPEHNSIHTQIPELCWQAVQDPDGETVTYWVDLMGAEYAQSGWISDTCWQPNVSKTGVYAWHVQSRDSAGAQSAYSSDWTFIVQEPATATPTPSPTPTPTPVPVWRFSGYTYRGQPDQATALGGVTLHLYGRNDGDPEPGDWEKSVTTNTGGYFNFHIIEPWNFDHFTLVAEPPEGLVAVRAWSANGNVIAPDTITWDYPQVGSHENKFYFDVPTPTPTPTSTPTVTPTPTPSRQWLPVIIAP